jgi:hypothetical protein
MRLDAITIAGLKELGVNARLRAIDVDVQGRMRPFAERVELFEQYKVELKKMHRTVALECHPDRTFAEPAEVRGQKEERFKRITRAVEHVMKLAPRAPRPPAQQYVIVISGFGGVTSTATTGTAESIFTNGTRIVW